MTMSLTEAPKATGLSLIATMASSYGLAPKAFEETIRKTVMPSATTNEEFCAFLLVAHKYNLNPITREIYAFPKKGGGIQPIVGVDGWMNLVNSHPAFDGVDFDDVWEGDNLEAVKCSMYRKDRSRPIVITEYLSECKRETEPWNRWPARMLRHKAYIQCARIAFGFSGIVDEDEFERHVVAVNAEHKAPERAALDINDLKAGDASTHVAVSEPTGPAPKPQEVPPPAKASEAAPAKTIRQAEKKKADKPAAAPVEPEPTSVAAEEPEPLEEHYTGVIAKCLETSAGVFKATSTDNEVFYTKNGQTAGFLAIAAKNVEPVAIWYTHSEDRFWIVKVEAV